MDFDQVADEVYAAPRADFVAVRDARAKAATALGDDDLARRIRELRKPSVAAWLINRVARAHPDRITELSALSESLLAAHTSLAGADLRRLSHERRELVSALTGLVRDTARDVDQGMSDAVTRQVQDTFEAALADPAVAAEVRRGRLSGAVEPGGTALWLATPDAVHTKPKPRNGSKPPTKPADDHAEALRRAESEVTRTTADRDRATRTLSEAEHQHLAATDTVEDLRRQLDAARKREHDTAESARTARRAFDRAEHAASTAQRRLDNLRDRHDA